MEIFLEPRPPLPTWTPQLSNLMHAQIMNNLNRFQLAQAIAGKEMITTSDFLLSKPSKVILEKVPDSGILHSNNRKVLKSQKTKFNCGQKKQHKRLKLPSVRRKETDELPDEETFVAYFAEQTDSKILKVLSQHPSLPLIPKSKPYPPSLVLKMRSAMWSELRERVRRSPYLASIFRHLWASTMGKSRSSTGNSPSSSASSSPNSSSPEDPNQVQGSTQKQVCTGNRAYTRRKGQPQKILPTSEHFLPTEFCESDNFIESMNLNSMKQHFALN